MSDNKYKHYPSLVMDEIMEVFDKNDHGSLEPINFGKGVSCFNPLEYVDTNLCTEQLCQHVGYGDIKGLLELRQAIARYYQEKFNYDLSPERICITDGASGALTIAMAMLLQKGGELALPASRYPAYDVMAQIFEAHSRFASMREDGYLDVNSLARIVSHKTQAIIINSPSNPYGTCLSDAELGEIANLGTPVIFDEVYQSLPLDNATIPSAIHYSDKHMIISSLSKSLAIAGFRVGYLIVPESQIQQMTNVKAVLNMCTSLPSQMLAEQLLQQWDLLVGKHRQMLQDNWTIFSQVANDLGLKLRSKPKAGFFALVDVSNTVKDAHKISLELAQKFALSTTPGIDFQSNDHDYLRLNFACPADQIEKGLKLLASYIKYHQEST